MEIGVGRGVGLAVGAGGGRGVGLAVGVGRGVGDKVGAEVGWLATGVGAEVGVDVGVGDGTDGAAVTADGVAGSVVEGGRDEVADPVGEQAASIETRSSPTRDRRSAIAVVSYPGRRG